MPFECVPDFMRELECKQGLAPLALRFLILTATRTSEVLKATWDEINLNEAIWVIPAERMKAGVEHRVPLSDAALQILDTLPRIQGNPYLFPSIHHSKSLSNMALLQVMRKLGYGKVQTESDVVKRGDAVPHGFRSSFRDWSGEISPFPRDVAEMALAHVIENKAEAAYRRGDLFAKRRKMMQAWSEFLHPKSVDRVVSISSARKSS